MVKTGQTNCWQKSATVFSNLFKNMQASHYRRTSETRLKNAKKGIEKFRKANYRVLVTDQEGNPIKNAPVHAVLARHAFTWGLAINSKALCGGSRQDQEMYKKIVSSGSFNKVTIENALKWNLNKKYDSWDLNKNYGSFLMPTLKWCRKNNLPVRGHVLMWPDFKRIPKNLHHLKNKPQQLRQVLNEHIRKFSTKWGNYIAEWDVLNEPFSHHEFMDILGDKVVADWFKLAHKADPKFKSYINDWGILTGSTYKHRKNYRKWINVILKNKAPLSGIGFQSHFEEDTFPAIIYNRIQEFTKFKQDLLVTEFDFNTKNQGMQADFTEKFMTLIFGHPRMTGLVTWSLWAKKAWKPDAAFYAKNWTKKPNAKRWDRLVNKVWHTDVNLRTNNKGEVSFRGFKGTYDIEVKNNGRVINNSANLDQDKKIILRVS